MIHNSYTKRSIHFRRIAKNDKVLEWALKNNFGGHYNYRLDELKRACGIDRYYTSYFCPGFFTDAQYAKSKQSYFDDLKKTIKRRLNKLN